MAVNQGRAVIWCAVSSKIQAADDKVSLGEQERLAREWTTGAGLRVVDVLSVPGHSRAETDILTLYEDYAAIGVEAYQRLRAHWQANDFDVLVGFAPNRLGRSFSIIAFVLENAVKHGRRAYLLQGGWVDASNVDSFIAMAGWGTKSETRQRIAVGDANIEKRMARGLHTRAIPFSHRPVRDERGRSVRLEVREDLRRLFEDAADLLLDGVGWLRLPEALAQRGHINPATGHKWQASRLRRLFLNPYTWGAASIGYLDKIGLWAFDERHPLPEGVRIERSPSPPIPAIWTGERAAAIKAELRRRHELQRGRGSWTRYHLSGLMVCAGCGHRLAVSWKETGKARRIYWICPAAKTRHYGPCPSRQLIHDDKAKVQIGEFIRRAALLGMVTLGISDKGSEALDRLGMVEREISAIEGQVGRMILDQANAPENLRSIYQRKIAEAGQQLATIEDERRRLLAIAPSPTIQAAQGEALRALIEHVEDLWDMGAVEVNRLLLAALGRARFVVKGKAIVDVR
jgi:hypothetical protein